MSKQLCCLLLRHCCWCGRGLSRRVWSVIELSVTCGGLRVALVAYVVEVDEEMLVFLEHVVVNDADLDVPFRLARLEDESPCRELVVGTRVRRPVLRPVVHVRRRGSDVTALKTTRHSLLNHAKVQ